MQRRSNIMSMALMAIVLLLGIFVPSMPNLDDGDDNVGCAAVMPKAERQAASEVAGDERQLHRSEAKLSTTTAAVVEADTAPGVSVTAMLFLSQVSPPLRP
jgi:competence protein ComGC